MRKCEQNIILLTFLFCFCPIPDTDKEIDWLRIIIKSVPYIDQIKFMKRTLEESDLMFNIVLNWGKMTAYGGTSSMDASKTAQKVLFSVHGHFPITFFDFKQNITCFSTWL